MQVPSTAPCPSTGPSAVQGDHICSVCGHTFDTDRGLTNHISHTHSPNKRHDALNKTKKAQRTAQKATAAGRRSLTVRHRANTSITTTNTADPSNTHCCDGRRPHYERPYSGCPYRRKSLHHGTDTGAGTHRKPGVGLLTGHSGAANPTGTTSIGVTAFTSTGHTEHPHRSTPNTQPVRHMLGVPKTIPQPAGPIVPHAHPRHSG